MGGIRFCRCGCQSENPCVCFGAKPTQRARARSLTRLEGRGKEGPREQSAEGSRRRQSAEGSSSRHERAVKRRTVSKRDQSAEGGSQKMKAGQRRE